MRRPTGPGCRALVVAERFPWPARGGGDQRLLHVVQGLAQRAQVDLFVVARGFTRRDLRPVRPVSRLGGADAPPVGRGPAHRARWVVVGRLPNRLAFRDFTGQRAALGAWAGPEAYDLVWFETSALYTAVGEAVHSAGPRPVVIVDMDDLEDARISQELRGAQPGAERVRTGLRASVHPMVLRLDRRRWRRLQCTVAGEVQVVVACREDAERITPGRALVIPNGYEPVASPVGRPRPGAPPVVGLVGTFSYGPNLDAAQFLVREVLPKLRAHLPGAAVHLIGPHDGRLEELCRPGVIATGWVDDIEPELARIDTIAAPLRYGAGTRIKILEGFAHRIPVVSTPAGCAGLDVVPGQQLLVAESAEDFAGGLVRCLTDLDLRRRLVDEAFTLFEAQYRWDAIERDIAALVP